MCFVSRNKCFIPAPPSARSVRSKLLAGSKLWLRAPKPPVVCIEQTCICPDAVRPCSIWMRALVGSSFRSLPIDHRTARPGYFTPGVVYNPLRGHDVLELLVGTLKRPLGSTFPFRIRVHPFEDISMQNGFVNGAPRDIWWIEAAVVGNALRNGKRSLRLSKKSLAGFSQTSFVNAYATEESLVLGSRRVRSAVRSNTHYRFDSIAILLAIVTLVTAIRSTPIELRWCLHRRERESRTTAGLAPVIAISAHRYVLTVSVSIAARVPR